MNIKGVLSSTMLIFYACTIMYLLLDVKWKNLSKKRKVWSILYFIVFITLNIWVQLGLGDGAYGKCYLLFTQLPVFVLFLIISNYKGIKLFFVLLTAVFFSAPVMMFLSILRSFMVLPLWLHLVGYFSMILLIKRFFKDSFNYMLDVAEHSVFVLFTSVPLLYYIYSYSLTQYQLADRTINKQYFIEQIPLFIVLISYILLTQMFKMLSEKATLENAQHLAHIQLHSASKQIEQLSIADKQSAIYRHDLRHHMRYLHACITENRLEEAEKYIKQTCADVDAITLKRYSENEPINLILSYYVGKAKEKEIALELNVLATDFSRFHITDLCSLLSNALENAIETCSQVEDASLRYVKLRLFEKSNRFCMELRNGYIIEPVFENKVPISQKNGHGIGVKSMIHVVEKYEGIYGFTAKDGEFRFQMTM